MTIVSARYPPTPLPYAKGQNLEEGLAELIQQSAANLATLKGHTNGGGTVATLPNPAPLNPSGEYGHDHSGGEYGRPLFRTVATMTFDNGSLSSANTSQINEGNTFRALDVPDGADSTTTQSANFSFWIWVPPCDPDPTLGAYQRLGICWRLKVFSSALISGDTAKIRFWRNNPQATGQTVYELSITSPETTGNKFVDGGTTTILPVKVGAINEIVAHVQVTRTTGGSSRGALFYVTEVELGVYKTFA